MKNLETKKLLKKGIILPKAVNRVDVLITEVKKSPDNLQEAFTATSLILGNSPRSNAQYYYSKIKKNLGTSLFLLESAVKKSDLNVKNRFSKEKLELTSYDIVLTLVKTLSKEQKVTIMQKLLVEL